MTSIFWRIFFSFWLLLIALSAATFAIDVESMPPGAPGLDGLAHFWQGLASPDRMTLGASDRFSGPPPPPPDGLGGLREHRGFGGPDGPPNDPGMGFSAGTPFGAPFDFQAVRIYQRFGAQAVGRYFDTVRNATGIRFYMFDRTGRLIAGALPTSAVREIASQAVSYGHLRVSVDHGVVLHADIVDGVGNLPYTLVDAATPPPTDYMLFSVRIFCVLLIATLVCWWLSRQITRPIIILRSAVRDVAIGRFQTRACPSMKGRKDEIGLLAKDFDTMADKLQNLVMAQSRLLADVSHELRSPLARLTLAAAIARRSAGDGSTESFDRVDREAERLNELIGELTSLSRLELGDALPNTATVDFDHLVKAVIIDAGFESEEKACPIYLDVDRGAPFLVLGDHELLRRAVDNIVRNAVRYTYPETTIIVTLRHTIKDSAPRIELQVRDHGPGVDDSEIEDIFRPFYRTSTARDRQSGGVGLGLAIVDRAVRQHGGSVSARNAPDGGGLVVTLELPAAPLAHAARNPEVHREMQHH